MENILNTIINFLLWPLIIPFSASVLIGLISNIHDYFPNEKSNILKDDAQLYPRKRREGEDPPIDYNKPLKALILDNIPYFFIANSMWGLSVATAIHQKLPTIKTFIGIYFCLFIWSIIIAILNKFKKLNRTIIIISFFIILVFRSLVYLIFSV